MIEKQWIVVTGGTGILGGGLVRLLRSHNLPVVANYQHDEIRAKAVAVDSGCELYRADVRQEDQVQAMLRAYPPRAVVHCAGRNADSLVSRTSPESWNEVLESHLYSVFVVAQEAMKVLPRNGQLILIGSRVGKIGNIGQAAYAAAKGAVHGLTQAAALEAAPLGIRVNAVLPGFVPSEMSENLSPEWAVRRRSENIFPNPDASQSFAELVYWLLTSNLPITGQLLRPDCRLP